MSIIHMETEEVQERARHMMYAASDIMKKADALGLQMRHLRRAWSSPQADYFFSEWNGLFRRLITLANELDQLSLRVMREVDKWISKDHMQSGFLQEVKKHLQSFPDLIEDIKDIERIGAAGILASTLRWSPKRPNSIIFTGPNWLRECLNIKPMTRVIRPGTLAFGMAVEGLGESVWEGIQAGWESFHAQEGFSRSISAAIADGSFKFSISALGKVGIPLVLGSVMTVVGAPVLVSGAVVLVGTVVGVKAYSMFFEEPVWNWWKHSTMRARIIENEKRNYDRALNYAQALVEYTITQPARKVQTAFSHFIHNLAHAPIN